MDKKYRILIVDDEESLCEILQFNLEGEDYYTETVNSGEEALKKNFESFDLIILDVMMGEMSGFKLAGIIRKEMNLQVPIIFITAKAAENDLITGFSLGGDDYITKPFSIKEVIVRVKAVLKRFAVSNNSRDLLRFENLELNLATKAVKVDNIDAKLTKKEFEILALLLKSDGRLLSREEILNSVWADGSIVTDRTVDVHVTRLRKKIGRYGDFIKSRSGYGYTFYSEQ